MKRFVHAITVLVLLSSAVSAVILQQDDLPRRIENPQAFRLPGGSRIEFETFFSPALQKESHYSVFFPPSYDDRNPEKRFSVVYLLHGMWNDHTSWVVDRYGSIPERLERLMIDGRIPEFLVVSPDGENSFYTDFLDGSRNFEQLIYRDLLTAIESKYCVLCERKSRAIAGVSMGGYGALKIAMKFPRLYSSVAAVSPIVFLGDDPSAPIIRSTARAAQYFQSALKPVYGMPFEPNHWHENSLEVLARTADCGDVNIYFSYGTADRYNRSFPMKEGVETLSRILEERGIHHEFREIQDGPHGWGLVQQELEEVFAFVAQTF